MMSTASYNNLTPDTELPKNFSMSLLRTINLRGNQFEFFRKLIHMLVMMLGDLQAGTILFSDVVGVNRLPNFEEFVIFL